MILLNRASLVLSNISATTAAEVWILRNVSFCHSVSASCYHALHFLVNDKRVKSNLHLPAIHNGADLSLLFIAHLLLDSANNKKIISGTDLITSKVQKKMFLRRKTQGQQWTSTSTDMAYLWCKLLQETNTSTSMYSVNRIFLDAWIHENMSVVIRFSHAVQNDV